MQNNVRPADMARITNFELANAFIEDQVAQRDAAHWIDKLEECGLIE